jgi:hypothetical protein
MVRAIIQETEYSKHVCPRDVHWCLRKSTFAQPTRTANTRNLIEVAFNPFLFYFLWTMSRGGLWSHCVFGIVVLILFEGQLHT